MQSDLICYKISKGITHMLIKIKLNLLRDQDCTYSENGSTSKLLIIEFLSNIFFG